jgi:hypothetical protein
MRHQNDPPPFRIFFDVCVQSVCLFSESGYVVGMLQLLFSEIKGKYSMVDSLSWQFKTCVLLFDYRNAVDVDIQEILFFDFMGAVFDGLMLRISVEVAVSESAD